MSGVPESPMLPATLVNGSQKTSVFVPSLFGGSPNEFVKFGDYVYRRDPSKQDLVYGRIAPSIAISRKELA